MAIQDDLKNLTPQQRAAALQNIDNELNKRKGAGGVVADIGGRVGAGALAGIQALPSILGRDTGQEPQKTAQEQLAEIKLQETLDTAKATATESARKRKLFSGEDITDAEVVQDSTAIAPREPVSLPGAGASLKGLAKKPGFIEVPVKRTATGEIETKFVEDPETVAGQKRIEESNKRQIERQFKKQAGQAQATSSFQIVSKTLQDLGTDLVSSWEEGSGGSLSNSLKTKAVLKLGRDSKNIGLDPAKFVAGGKISGKRTEFLTKVMPILTQQGDKQGSVRLITTVFEKLGLTIPDLNTAPEIARGQIEATIQSMFGFVRPYLQVLNQAGLNNDIVEEELSDEEIDDLANQIIDIAGSIDLTPQEQKQTDDAVATVLRPIDAFLAKEKGGADTTDIDNELAQIEKDLLVLK